MHLDPPGEAVARRRRAVERVAEGREAGAGESGELLDAGRARYLVGAEFTRSVDLVGCALLAGRICGFCSHVKSKVSVSSTKEPA